MFLFVAGHSQEFFTGFKACYIVTPVTCGLKLRRLVDLVLQHLAQCFGLFLAHLVLIRRCRCRYGLIIPAQGSLRVILYLGKFATFDQCFRQSLVEREGCTEFLLRVRGFAFSRKDQAINKMRPC